MESCTFCRIAKGERDQYEVYEDDSFMGFLDIRPRTKGHALVIPKKHYRWVDDVEEFGEYFEVCGVIGRAAKRALEADWLQLLTIGEAVPHAHVHVVPRYRDDGHGALINLGNIEFFNKDEMQEIAETIRDAIDEKKK